MLLRSVGMRINQTGLLRNSRFYPGSPALLGQELEGFALDFLDDSVSVRTLQAIDLISSEAQGFALDFVSNTSAVRTT